MSSLAQRRRLGKDQLSEESVQLLKLFSLAPDEVVLPEPKVHS